MFPNLISKHISLPASLLIAELLIRELAATDILGCKTGSVWLSLDFKAEPVTPVARTSDTQTDTEKSLRDVGSFERYVTVRGKLFAPMEDYRNFEHDVEGTCRLFGIETNLCRWRPHFARVTVDGEYRNFFFAAGSVANMEVAAPEVMSVFPSPLITHLVERQVRRAGITSHIDED